MAVSMGEGFREPYREASRANAEERGALGSPSGAPRPEISTVNSAIRPER